MEAIQDLIQELVRRMEKDHKRVYKWRLWHRTIGIVFTVTLIALPASMASGLLPMDSVLSRVLLIILTTIGGLNAVFKPHFHSQWRRLDMNESRKLHDEFRSEIVKAGSQNDILCSLFQDYSKKFAGMYASRGERLVDAVLALRDIEKQNGERSCK